MPQNSRFVHDPLYDDILLKVKYLIIPLLKLIHMNGQIGHVSHFLTVCDLCSPWQFVKKDIIAVFLRSTVNMLNAKGMPNKIF